MVIFVVKGQEVNNFHIKGICQELTEAAHTVRCGTMQELINECDGLRVECVVIVNDRRTEQTFPLILQAVSTSCSSVVVLTTMIQKMEVASLDAIQKRVSVLKMDIPAGNLLLILQLCNTHQVIQPEIVQKVALPEGVDFTRRESEIFPLSIDPFYSQKDIARILNVSHKTVNAHMSNINRKLKIKGGRRHLILRYGTKP